MLATLLFPKTRPRKPAPQALRGPSSSLLVLREYKSGAAARLAPVASNAGAGDVADQGLIGQV